MGEGFGYFDKLFLINLDCDTDRLLRVSRRFAELGLAVERYTGIQSCERLSPAVDHALKPGHFGCARSHQELLQLVWSRGYNQVVIFEDDVVFRDDVLSWMRRTVPQLVSFSWDVFYLGSHVVRGARTASDNLIQVFEGHHTHAYAVSRKAVPRLIHHIERAIEVGRAFDGFEVPELLKLCVSPILAIQEPNHSYSLGCFVDRTGQYFEWFDRREFEAHCSEMRHWSSSFGRLVAPAKWEEPFC
jgi:GR25 family glycosyltransferase involved in LPS biosynthesis